MEKRFTYAVGDSWLLFLYGTRAKYTIIKAEYDAKNGKEIYTVDVEGTIQVFNEKTLSYRIRNGFYKKLQSGKFSKYQINDVSKSDIQAYYAEMRYAEDKRLERVQAILDSSDDYQNIMAEISAYTRDVAKAEFFHADILKVKTLRTKLQAAQAERVKILKSLKLKPEDLKKRVRCNKCGDYGYVNNTPCVCTQEHMPAIIEKMEKEREKAGAKAI